MKKYRKFSVIVLFAALMAIAFTMFGAMALAQDRSQSPEDGPEGPNLRPPPHAVEEIEMSPEAEAPDGEAVLFKSFAGAVFHPRESTTTHSYSGAGCVHRTSESGWFIKDLQLPNGAEIDFIRLYFYDINEDAEAELFLYGFNGAGEFTQIQQITSSGAPGYSSVGSDFFSHEVDNGTQSLALVAGMDNLVDNSSVAICGARVRYRVDVPSFSLLPVFLRDYIGG